MRKILILSAYIGIPFAPLLVRWWAMKKERDAMACFNMPEKK